ncbi:MAG TPA: ABC transporter substrate-binding protein [Candidatus Limnocylindria bacterium]|nr:ABC transporter substrate-binding protein [Candidatus Limnocylindria bacterium]
MAGRHGLLALALVGALIVAACGGAGTPAPLASAAAGSAQAAATTALPVKLVVGYSEIYEGELPVWAAFEAGIFKANRLDVDLRYTASTTGIAALLANETQIFQGGGSEAMSANLGGEDLVLVGNLVPVYPYVFMVQKEIGTAADLKGKKVGVSNPGSTSDIATRVGLAKVGLVPDKDVTIIAVGSSQNRTAALQSGQIQGGLDQPPFSYDLEKLGLHTLFSMAEQRLPIVNNGIVVKRSYLAANKAVVQRYVDSIVQAIAKVKQDKAFAIGVYKKYLKIDDENTLGRTWEYATTQLFPSLPYPKLDQFNDITPELAKRNDKAKTYDPSKMIDESLVKSAADRGLDKQ